MAMGRAGLDRTPFEPILLRDRKGLCPRDLVRGRDCCAYRIGLFDPCGLSALRVVAGPERRSGHPGGCTNRVFDHDPAGDTTRHSVCDSERDSRSGLYRRGRLVSRLLLRRVRTGRSASTNQPLWDSRTGWDRKSIAKFGPPQFGGLFAGGFQHAQPGCITVTVADSVYRIGAEALANTAGGSTPEEESTATCATQGNMRRTCQPVGLQLLRPRILHLQPARELLLVLLPVRQYLLDSYEWLRGAVCKRQMESLRRRFRRL